MSKLSHLRRQLRVLRFGRRLYRWGAAWSSVVAIALAALLILFAIDVVFEVGVGPRVVLLLIAGAAVLGAFIKLAWPWLFQRENDLEMALLVERRLGRPGRSDLAAALQFESPVAAAWGSSQLEQAVIERVSQETRHVNVFAGSSLQPLIRRVAGLAVLVVVALAVVVIWPRHVPVFFQRLALGEQHYPSRTVIHTVHINGREVLAADARLARPHPARCAEGEPLRIVVAVRGIAPESGEVEVVSRAARQRRTLRLRQVDPQDAASNPVLREVFSSSAEHPSDETVFYLAELDRLMEPLRYQIFLGDAWTDPASIDMAPLPAVEPKFTVTAPDYAQAADPSAATAAGSRQLSVLEGSRIDLEVTCVNEKALDEVVLAITRDGKTERFPLQPASGEKLQWRLAGKSPLSRVTQEFRYVIDVRDIDGLQPTTPLAGLVRIKPDRAPHVTARLVTRVVLPTATPVVNLDLSDDYGVERPTLELKITRENGSQETRTLTELPLQAYNAEGRLASQAVEFPLKGEQLPWRGGCRVNLAPLNLAKGDRVSAVFVVTDYRGSHAERASQAASQPLEWEVSDEAGVYRAALEADQQALEDITEAADLQQQLLRSNE